MKLKRAVAERVKALHMTKRECWKELPDGRKVVITDKEFWRAASASGVFDVRDRMRAVTIEPPPTMELYLPPAPKRLKAAVAVPLVKRKLKAAHA